MTAVVLAFAIVAYGPIQGPLPHTTKAERLALNQLIAGSPADIDKALSQIDAMERAAERAPEPKRDWAAYARWKRAVCLFRQGKVDEAREKLRAVIDAERTAAKATPGTGRFYLPYMLADLGEFELKHSLFAPALRHFDDAIAHAAVPMQAFGGDTASSRDHDPLAVANWKLLRARALAGMKDVKGAADALDSTQAMATGQPTTAMGWNDLRGRCQFLRADLARMDERAGLAVQQTADTLRGPLSDRVRYDGLLQLARLYRIVCRFDDALAKVAEAERTIATAPDSAARRTECLGARADVAIDRARFRHADEPPQPDRVLRLATTAEETADTTAKQFAATAGGRTALAASAEFVRAQARALRGDVLRQQGKSAEADAAYAAAAADLNGVVEAYQKAFAADHDLLLQARRERARVAMARGRVAEARAEAVEAHQRFRGRQGHERNVDNTMFLQLLLDIEARDGKPGPAARYADELRRLFAERSANVLPLLTAGEQTAYLRTHDDPGLYAALRLGTRYPELAEKSFEWVLNGKAAAAEFTAQAVRGRSGGAEAGTYLALVRRQAGILYGPNPEASRDDFLRAEAGKRDIAVKGKAVAPPWRTLADFRPTLAKDEAYVDVACLPATGGEPRAYFAWVVTPGRPVVVRRLCAAEAVDRIVSRWTGQHRVEPAEYKKLAELLLRPIEADLAGHGRWTICQDGPLWAVPWAALVLADGRYAVEAHTIRYVVSGRDRLVPAAAPARGPPWLMANPSFDAAIAGHPRWAASEWLKPLPFAAAEGKAVATAFGVQLADPTTATKYRLLAAPRPRLVYLATHGVRDRVSDAPLDYLSDPMLRCGVAFAGANRVPPAGEHPADLPGILTGAELLAADFRGTELVALSACSTGVGDRRAGQSPADLRHAFHLAGARAVVSTLWDVDDAGTGLLMTDFAKALAARPGEPALALQSAQERLLRSGGKFAAPHYWAGFCLSESGATAR